jgi:hypothetical protein
MGNRVPIIITSHGALPSSILIFPIKSDPSHKMTGKTNGAVVHIVSFLINVVVVIPSQITWLLLRFYTN